MTRVCSIGLLGLLAAAGCQSSLQVPALTPTRAQGVSSAFEAPVVLRDGRSVHIEGVSLERRGDRSILHGRVRSAAQSGLAASTRIVVRTWNENQPAGWMGTTRIRPEPVIRLSRHKHTGTFRLELPSGESFQRVEVSVTGADDAVALAKSRSPTSLR